MAKVSGLATLASSLAAGSVSSVALARKFLDDVTNSAAAFIAIDHRLILDEARASDERRQCGCALSPFDGVLFAVKDNTDVAGYRTTNGSKFRLSSPVCTADAAIVAPLRKAGLIVCGKSNLSELAFSGLGLNPHFGTPSLKEFDPRRAPGGSSSGSAIAVAEGLVPLALGTDTAGSLRVPAAFNEVIGFRASSSRYPMTGIEPLAKSFDSQGALARSVADLIICDSLTTGRLRIGKPVDEVELLIDVEFLAACGVSEEVGVTFNDAIAALGASGVRVLSRPIPQLFLTLDLIAQTGWPGSREAFERFAELLSSSDRKSIDPRVVSRLELARDADAISFERSMARRAEWIGDFADQVGERVVVLPTVSIVPPLLEPLERDPTLFARTNLEVLRLTMIGSFLDAAVVAMPVGRTSSGLPVSLSLLAPRGHDQMALQAAILVEECLGD